MNQRVLSAAIRTLDPFQTATHEPLAEVTGAIVAEQVCSRISRERMIAVLVADQDEPNAA
jgi:hypothetical protein